MNTSAWSWHGPASRSGRWGGRITAMTSRSEHSPFLLDHEVAYRRWRAEKLSDYPGDIGDLVVEIRDPGNLSEAELDAIQRRIRKTNMALYASAAGDDPDKGIVRAIGFQLGLTRLDSNWLADDDGVTSLTVSHEGPRPAYIPYTNRPIKWHTDGYYNRPERQIHGLLLHCVRPAAQGGENALWDPELAYLMLRDESPDYIRALMVPDAMTIPPGTDAEGGAREAAAGPVFSIRPDGALHMRYTARERNVIWKEDPEVRAAASRLQELLADPPFAYRGKLESGMGLICNNVLHDRAAFSDSGASAGRLLYRARFYDRVSDT